jgi:hypothetical protein
MLRVEPQIVRTPSSYGYCLINEYLESEGFHWRFPYFLESGMNPTEMKIPSLFSWITIIAHLKEST